MTQPLLVLGTRMLALELADLIGEIPGFQLVGFVENLEPARCRDRLEGLPVYWVDDIDSFAATHYAICGISTTHRSQYVEQVAAKGFRFATVVHPTARMSPKTTLGAGTILSAGVIIASHTQLGQHVFVNRGALIGHHTMIGDYVTIQPGANIAGACKVRTGSYIGMSAVVLDRLNIGAHTIVGAGAVVTKDVPDHTQVVGVPARVVKERIRGK